MEPATTPNTPESSTSGLRLAIAWLVVGAPLLWGVSQTFIKALALFQ
ncbi:MFS transporter small subunit [Hymenobacter guriensis]|uniref:Oxalate:formate antiporter n=1 Tax=Hymenobacter guriensis TaxID=2793065 RepID=A0ABS0L2E1_9BACT|nr:hypothetical protein [Hymenobacter guriensis]MBG8554292.1 hypothetical protein [Hymenobacter guriensis]